MQAMETGDFLEHFGVKGMKWGVIRSKEQRQENRQARATTRKEVRKINSIPTTRNDADIVKARKQLADAERRKADARDQYKVDKHTMNKIDAKRPLKVAAADLRRIQDQADQLTKDEQFAFDMMQSGRAVVDIFSKPENRRDGTTKLLDEIKDRQRILDEGMRKANS